MARRSNNTPRSKINRWYARMMEDGCVECGSEDTYATVASIYPGDKDRTPVAICDECGHAEEKYVRKSKPNPRRRKAKRTSRRTKRNSRRRYYSRRKK